MRVSESAFIKLECPECGRIFDPDIVQTCCPDCSSPLFAAYDFNAALRTLTRESAAQRRAENQSGLWRWCEILPVRAPAFRLTLGENSTPLLQANNLGKALGLHSLTIKDESRSPQGSLESREMVVAVARALELGVHGMALAATGSDGAALAACAARSRVQAHIYMTKDTSLPEQIAVKILGADLHLVDGSFFDIARQANKSALLNGWYNISAFQEPYRCEGAKTLGLELAQDFAWDLPDVVIVPGSSGMQVLGIWKAFRELEQMGFIGAKRPRIVMVQALGCPPFVSAFDEQKTRAEHGQDGETVFSNLRTADVLADRPVLRAIMESNGIALAAADDQILTCQKEMAASEGIFMAPQGAAGLVALKQLISDGRIHNDERVVMINAGSGLKYL